MGGSQEYDDKKIVYVPVYPTGVVDSEDEIDLFDLFSVLLKYKRFIIVFTLLCTLLAAIISLFILPKKYKSEFTLRASPAVGQYLRSNKLKISLISKYNLLPSLYPELWDSQKKSWKTNAPPTVEQAVAENKLSFIVSKDRKTGLLRVEFDSMDPRDAQLMLKRVLTVMKDYFSKDYISESQRQIEVLDEEAKNIKKVIDEWISKIKKINSSDSFISERMLTYLDLKKQIAELRVKDALERQFFVIDAPLLPIKPFKPKFKLIILVSAVSSLFLAIFLVFFFNFIQEERRRRSSNN